LNSLHISGLSKQKPKLRNLQTKVKRNVYEIFYLFILLSVIIIISLKAQTQYPKGIYLSYRELKCNKQ